MVKAERLLRSLRALIAAKMGQERLIRESGARPAKSTEKERGFRVNSPFPFGHFAVPLSRSKRYAVTAKIEG